MITTANGKGVAAGGPRALARRQAQLPRRPDVARGVRRRAGDRHRAGGVRPLGTAAVAVRRARSASTSTRCRRTPTIPPTVAVIGDAAPALAGLVDALGDATDAPARRRSPACARSWMPSTAPRRRRGSTGSPSLATRSSDDAIVVGDSAMCCYYGALGGFPVRRPALVPLPDRVRHARLRRPRGARREARRARPAGARAVGRRRADVHGRRAGVRRRARPPAPRRRVRQRAATGRSATRWWTPAIAPVGVDLATARPPRARPRARLRRRRGHRAGRAARRHRRGVRARPARR